MTEKEMHYKYHQENVLAIEEGLGFVMGNIRGGIVQEHLAKSTEERKRAKRYVLIQSRILSGLIVSWSEEIIKRLFYEPNAFSVIQIQKLHELNLQQKWEFSLKAAFCKAYNVRNSNGTPLFNGLDIENQSNLGRTAKDRFKHAMNLINDELLPAINIRNKVQHGEWIKAFNPPDSLSFSPDLTGEINKENIVALQTKINQFQAIYQLIHDLAAGNNASTFERDFDRNYKRIESNRHLLRIRTVDKYKQEIIGRYERGIIWKRQNQSPLSCFNRMITQILQ